MIINIERIDKQIDIKETWDEVSVAAYIQLNSIARSKKVQFDSLGKIDKNDPVKHLKLINDLEKIRDADIETISLLTDLTSEECLDLSPYEFDKLKEYIYKIFEHEVTPNPIKAIYKIAGKKYKVTKTLDIIKEERKKSAVREINTNQFLDILHLMNNGIEGEAFYNLLPILLAVVMIPEGEKYGTDYFNIETNADIIKDNLSICDALGVSAFFLKVYEIYSMTLKRYCVSKTKKMLIKAIRKERNTETKKIMKGTLQALKFQMDSLKNGDGNIILHELQS